MLFNSYEFIFMFLPLAVGSYWLVHQRFGPSASTVLLALVSYVFYVRSEPNYPFLLVCSILLNLGFGLWIPAASVQQRKTIGGIGIALDLAVLGYFKYASLICETLATIGLYSGEPPNIPLPAGISFYTFTQIAFLADATIGAVRNHRVPSYFLFVTLFPHLIAGPILHHQEMVTQFEQRKRLSIANHILAGLVIFAIGLAKKTILADSVSPVATAVFSASQAGHAPGLFEAWVGSIAYSMQIYFDFSGYSDMAIGIALMFGIRLPINFNSPYKSTSIVDFWRRWHITLSRFLREYLYISLGGNRHGHVRRYLNLFATMALGGLWHGAAWTFVVWGAAHGIALAFVHTWGRVRRSFSIGAMPRPLAVVLTFIVVTVLWVPFRADSFTAMWRIWMGMTGGQGLGLPQFGLFERLGAGLHLPVTPVPFGTRDVSILIACIIVAWFAPNTQQLMARYRPGLDSEGYNSVFKADWYSLRLRPITVIAMALMFGAAVAMISPNSEFIYFRF